MTFKQWIVGYMNSDTPRGDLARDIDEDRKFPDTNDFKSMLSYLNNKWACYEAIQTFKRAYKAYAKSN